MSNLSDLLPAGAGAKSATFTADGTLSSGQTVILQSDGTVKAVAGTSITESVGSVTTFESATTAYIDATFDSSNNKVVIVYADFGNSGYSTAVVGTVSGTSISFGTPVVFASAINTYMSPTFDSSNNKVVIAYRDVSISGNGTAIVGTVSGTSISFGSTAVFNSGSTNYPKATFDTSNSKVVIGYSDDGNSNYSTAVVGTVSGTSISFGTEVVIESVTTSYVSSTYDSSSNKVVIAYSNDTNSLGKAAVGTVSGTSISFGSSVTFESAIVYYVSTTFDTKNNKVVISYRDGGNSNYGTAVVGTVSGTSISFGTPAVFDTVDSRWMSSTFDSEVNKVFIAYNDDTNSSTVNFITGTVSGTSITFGTDTVVATGFGNYNAAVFDSNEKRVVHSFRTSANSSYGQSVVIRNAGTSTNLTDTNFVGITDEAIANTATGSVVVEGGQITNSALIAAYLSAGSSATFESATNQNLNAVYDPDSQKVIFAYGDIGNGERGTAVVGTVSGTSISFGTPVVFTTGTGRPFETTLAYDTVNDKVVISYRNQANSSYPESVVGTVSGTSISFGTPVVINSTASSGTASVFDTASGKVVVATSDSSSTGAAIVGTVSGTSISFGSFTNFDSPATAVSDIGATYDSTNGKVVIAYRDQGNSNYGTAVVGTVSGTSISFGTPVVFNAGDSEKMDQAVVYDSTNQKVVIGYKDVGNSNYGTAIVGTVSGTSISFGTEVVFDASNLGSIELSGAFNSSRGEVGFVFGSTNTSFYPTIISGTVSGTSISFGSSLTLNTVNGNYYSLTYDVNADKFVAPYNNTSTSDAKVVSSSTDLTVGSTYYVQDDGSLSTTSSNVTAGKALSATKLLLKG